MNDIQTQKEHTPSPDAIQFKSQFEKSEETLAEFQQEYEKVLQLLLQDEGMSKFKQEYEKMHRSLMKSRDNVGKFYLQHAALEKEYTSNIEVTQLLTKETAQDKTSIGNLKSTISRYQENLTSSSFREESGKEQLRLLRGDISSLVMTLKQGVGLSSVQEKTLAELQAGKEQTTKELEKELDKIVTLRTRIQEVTEKIKEADEQKRRFEHEIYELKERNTIRRGDIEGEIRNKERLDKDLRDIREVVNKRSLEVQGKQDTVNRNADEISVIDHHLKSQRQMLERLEKEHENLTQRSIKLKQDCGEQFSLTAALTDENFLIHKEVKIKGNELSKLHNEVKKINKIKDALVKKNKQLEEQKFEIEEKRRIAKTENDQFNTDIDKVKRQVEVYKKTVDDFSREKGVIDANYVKVVIATQNSQQLLIPYKQAKENLEIEIERFEREISDQQRSLRQISIERDLYIKEAFGLQHETVDCIQAIKKKEIQIYDFKKQIVNADTKLKHQQALYEAVQSDRNLHAKHLVDAQSEIGEMKRKLKIMNYQINGFKEDINGKEEALSKEVTENTKLVKDIKTIEEETENLKNQNEIAQAYIKTQLAEELKLNQFVKEAELEKSRQENAWQVLISERDNLCNQLIRQDSELTKVYGKIKSNTTSLMTSEKQYDKKLKLIRETKIAIQELKSQKSLLKSETSEITEMNLKLCRLENEVVFEKTRVKALEEELENPVNLHRWRKLEGSNPKAYEMIQLMHALQKKLIEKTRMDNEKMNLIKEEEEIYLRCKSLLANQVGPEAVEQVKEFEKLLKDKKMQFRHMGTELNMYQAQAKEYKYAIERLDIDINELKQNYIQNYFVLQKEASKSTTPNSDQSKPQTPIDSYERKNTPSPLPPIPTQNFNNEFPQAESREVIDYDIQNRTGKHIESNGVTDGDDQQSPPSKLSTGSPIVLEIGSAPSSVTSGEASLEPSLTISSIDNQIDFQTPDHPTAALNAQSVTPEFLTTPLTETPETSHPSTDQGAEKLDGSILISEKQLESIDAKPLFENLSSDEKSIETKVEKELDSKNNVLMEDQDTLIDAGQVKSSVVLEKSLTKEDNITIPMANKEED